jgi:hypothetical protein
MSRLIADSGAAMYPAIASDGKLVAYIADRAASGSMDRQVIPRDHVLRCDEFRPTTHIFRERHPQDSSDRFTAIPRIVMIDQ